MSAPNTWTVGTFYVQPNGNRGLFEQPGGPGTEVFPAQQVGVDYFSTQPFSELTGVFSAGCGHFQDYPTLQQEVDYSSGEPVQTMLVICSVCSYIQYTLPIDQALSTVYQPQVPI